MSTTDRGELQTRALDLLKRAAESDVDLVCANAMEALVNVAPREGLPAFRAALNSSNKLIRLAGCRAVGEVRDTESINGIMRCMGDSDALLRVTAAYSAARCGEKGYEKNLATALGDGGNENVRAEAASLIGRLGNTRAKKRLEQVALRDKSSKVCIQAYGALAMLGDEAALDRLIGYTQGDLASRALSLLILAELGKERTKEALLFRMGPVEDYLENRLIAARGLGKLGSKAGYDLAEKNALYSTEDPQDAQKIIRIRSLSAHALGAIRDPRALPRLRQLAEPENDPLVQVAACYAICQILPPANSPPPKPEPLKRESRDDLPKPPKATNRR